VRRLRYLMIKELLELRQDPRLFGILFILVGILGEYIGRILVEVRGRPRYLVSELTGFAETRPDRRPA